MCILTGEVIDSIPKIFTNSHYNCWFEELKDQVLPILINTKNDNVHLLNQVRG